jgi:hypothetical protein
VAPVGPGGETDYGQGSREPEQPGEVFVGALLPPRAPDEVESAAQDLQVTGGRGRKNVRQSIDRVKVPFGGSETGNPKREITPSTSRKSKGRRCVRNFFCIKADKDWLRSVYGVVVDR